ncbi:DUF3604 domain-containing protein [Novosphingobium sp.]|uniref:DUF3604 domain-containing protein n=1 Tax=Novosphingobium sp. TaxID=1874826 RepID=UPI0025F06BD3|nr:DUF3604 domain-containing protein [Novosphingobium sp.]MCC6925701.1 DUF3604 domain-containing protein [Novosphingobium sp.]
MRKALKFGIAAIALGAAWWGWRSDPVQDALTSATAKEDGSVPLAPYPQRVYWGDTHLHTANSPDAFGFGNRLGPEQALRFARGEQVTATTGATARLARPLDFLVIADHSDGLGFSKMLADAPRFLLPDDRLKRWHDMFNAGPEQSQKATAEMIDLGRDMKNADKIADPKKTAQQAQSIWRASIRTVERFNDPGKFTAFLGFEFTSMPNGNNLHRVVMLRDGFDFGRQVVPAVARASSEPEALWDWMDRYEKLTGGRALAIPHNSNMSNGLMFEMNLPQGGPMTAAYARRRAAHEPVVEATQIKGDSESYGLLSPNDEFAGYGTLGWDKSNLDMTEATTPAMQAGNYVREALKRGLAIEAATGVNPYRFGLIGSTDSHTGLSTADEDNFFGKHTGNEPVAGKDRVNPGVNLGTRSGRFNWNYLAGGYAGVWARANTRAAIFDAMMRREVYATTGPRMTLRVFGGWSFDAAILQGDWVKAGYDQGVPMGGVLPQGQGVPSFVISALKDPIGANLDRVQVVKGWYGADSQMHEKVFDVVWSDPARRQLSDGKLPPVGNTVDLARASYSNSIGAPELATVWRDPEFDPKLRAFYYVRVLEIPTPRWIVYDHLRFGTKITPEMQPITQERAYSSPIWYEPRT